MRAGDERDQIGVPQMLEATAVTLAQGVEKNVLSHVGQLNACDLWFKVTPDWEPVVTLKLFARIAGGRVLLATKRLDETHRFTDDGYTSGLAFSLRGRPLEGLELNALCSDGSLANGQFMLSTWTGSEAPSFSAGVLQSESNVRVTDWTSAFGSVAAPVYVRPARAERAAYAVTSPIVQAPTTNGAATWLLGLFRTGGGNNTKRIEIERLTLSYHGGTTGHVTLQVCRTSAPGTSSGSRTIALFDRDASASTLSALGPPFGGGTPTPPTILDEIARYAARADKNGVFEWSASEAGKPIVLRAGATEGFGVRIVNEVALGAATNFTAAATVHWVEI